MSFLFKRVPKTPQELVRVLEELLVKLDTAADPKKALEDVHRYLKQAKALLTGAGATEQVAAVTQEICQSDCLYLLRGIKTDPLDAIEFYTFLCLKKIICILHGQPTLGTAPQSLGKTQRHLWTNATLSF